MRSNRLRIGHLGYVLVGATAGIGFSLLWLYVLTPGLPLWVAGLLAGGCALLLTGVVAQVDRRRTARLRPRRRAHARPHPTNPRKANP